MTEAQYESKLKQAAHSNSVLFARQLLRHLTQRGCDYSGLMWGSPESQGEANFYIPESTVLRETIGQNTVTNNEFPEEEQIGFWQEKHLSRTGTGILTVDPPN